MFPILKKSVIIKTTLITIIVCLYTPVQGAVWEMPRTWGEVVKEPGAEATQMRRYGEWPVDAAAGTARVTLPLMALSGGGDAPDIGLQLSATAGAVKRQQQSTYVGLGWSLDGLGYVSRSVEGVPDTWRGSQSGRISHQLIADSYDVDYLTSILTGFTDARKDRFDFALPGGWSGSFYISEGDMAVQMPPTPLSITFVRDPESGDYSRFDIKAPDGVVYRLEAMDRMKYEVSSQPNTYPQASADFDVTTQWNLTRILSPSDVDDITISWQQGGQWQRCSMMNLSSVSATYDCRSGGSMTDQQSMVGYGCHSTFTHYQPKEIRSRMGSITFDIRSEPSSPDNFYMPHDFITSVTLTNPSGQVIAVAALNNESRFADRRQKLSEVTVRSDGIITDHWTISYDDASDEYQGYDLFGYPNGRGSGSDVYCHSVINTDLELAEDRRSNDACLTWGAIRSVTDISGVATSIDYEPATIAITPAFGSPLPSVVTVGVRVRAITAKDAVTGRWRRRSLEYGSAQCDIPLRYLTAGDFMSQSGARVVPSPGASVVYNVGVTHTATATLQGRPLESARILYGKVTERVTGTAIAHPIVTSWEYDLSDAISTFVNGGSVYDDPNSYLGSGENCRKGLGALQGVILGDDHLREHLKAHPCRGYFRQMIGGTPLLVKKSEMEWDESTADYRVASTETYTYTRQRMSVTSALYCESHVLQNSTTSGAILDITDATEVNRFEIITDAVRSVLDKTIATRHYPDGNSRSVTTRQINMADADHISSAPGFYCDSIMAMPGLSHYPLGVITSCGDESIAHYSARADQIITNFYTTARSKSAWLPVIEKYVVRDASGCDSLLCRNEYGRFGQLYRPTRSWIETFTNSQCRPIISENRYLGYDAHGRIAAMVDGQGRKVETRWAETHNNPVEISIGGSDGGMIGTDDLSGEIASAGALTSLYEYTPLVGLTKITDPAGKSRSFSYNGGRLASERNTSGLTVASYGYRRWGDGEATGNDRRNLFSVSRHEYDSNGGELSSLEASQYDGFGMPVSVTTTAAGGDDGLIRSVTEYDAVDRPIRQYLPVEAVSVDEAPDDPLAQAVAQYGDSRPYVQTAFRGTPTEDVVEILSAGENLFGHPTKNQYVCNNTTDPMLMCRKYLLGASALVEAVTLAGFYAPGHLDVVRQADPDGVTLLTFTDWRGLTVMERRMPDQSTFADTYYLYDVRGNRRMVIQPEGARMMTQVGRTWDGDDEVIDQYAFVYRYDRRGNCIYARTAGCGPTEWRYDCYGRRALMRSASMAEDGEAIWWCYDPMGREAASGICSLSKSWTDDPDNVGASIDMSACFSATEAGVAESHYVFCDQATAALINAPVLLSANYYDTYDCAALDGFASLDASAVSTSAAARAKGRLTGRLTSTLSANTAGKRTITSGKSALASIYYYDDEGNVGSERQKTIGGGRLDISRSYSRQGYMTYEQCDLVMGDSTYVSILQNRYDLQGNLLGRTAMLNSDKTRTINIEMGAERIDYDRLGRVTRRSMPGTSVDYAYNLRGQVSSICSPQFSQQISYDDAPYSPCFNGNIAQTVVQFGDRGGVGYQYSYDRMNRLTAAMGDFDNNAIYQYDLNGNATRIVRSACATSINPGVVASMDDVSMSYCGNRLVKAVDQGEEMLFESVMDFPGGSSDYGYDSDGRMISDSGRDIEQITYSPDGHPLGIYFTDGSYLLYTYSADGQRLKERYGSSPDIIGGIPRYFYSDRYYIGCFELETQTNALLKTTKPILDRINLPWGYTDAQGSFFTYVCDYQGNVRAVVNSKGEAVQTNDYYPDGTLIATSTGQQLNRRKFGSKELETRSALNTYDQQARQYFAPALRFDNPDPLAANRPSESPYIFCANNPVNYVDPDGRKFVLAGEDPEKEKELLYTMIILALESESYRKVFNYLNEIKTKITLKYGDTKLDGNNDRVSGYFNPSNNSIVFDNKSEIPNAQIIAEESYHALQKFSILSYLNQKENKEFEAKVFSCIACSESNRLVGDIYGMSSFANYISVNFDRSGSIFTSKEYIKEGNQFAIYHRQKNITNANKAYTNPVKNIPFLLIDIVSKYIRK